MLGAWLELPVGALLLLLTIAYAATGSVMHWLSFHSPASQFAASFKGIVGPFFNSVAVIFALLGGFLAGDVWERSNRAERLVQGEADGLLALVDISMAAGSEAATLRDSPALMPSLFVNDEWPRMQEGEAQLATEAALARLRRALSAPPSTRVARRPSAR